MCGLLIVSLIVVVVVVVVVVCGGSACRRVGTPAEPLLLGRIDQVLFKAWAATDVVCWRQAQVQQELPVVGNTIQLRVPNVLPRPIDELESRRRPREPVQPSAAGADALHAVGVAPVEGDANDVSQLLEPSTAGAADFVSLAQQCDIAHARTTHARTHAHVST